MVANGSVGDDAHAVSLVVQLTGSAVAVREVYDGLAPVDLFGRLLCLWLLLLFGGHVRAGGERGDACGAREGGGGGRAALGVDDAEDLVVHLLEVLYLPLDVLELVGGDARAALVLGRVGRGGAMGALDLVEVALSYVAQIGRVGN